MALLVNIQDENLDEVIGDLNLLMIAEYSTH